MSASSTACVLVVDDEPDLRTLYELTLLREGHEVVSAPDLAQAREWLGQRRFDVLISDMRLPDGLGLELLRELGEQQRTEKTIVITAYGSAENAVEALKSGIAWAGGPPGIALSVAIGIARAVAKNNPELVGGPDGGISQSAAARNEFRRLRTILERFGSLPGASGSWGKVGTSNNIKVFGSDGLKTASSTS